MTIIKSINVLRNKKYHSVTVYINLENGRYEVFCKENDKPSRFTGSAELLAEAKKLSMRDGKWNCWSRTTINRNTEDAREDIEELSTFSPRPTVETFVEGD